jgi:hypothetical protein
MATWPVPRPCTTVPGGVRVHGSLLNRTRTPSPEEQLESASRPRVSLECKGVAYVSPMYSLVLLFVWLGMLGSSCKCGESEAAEALSALSLSDSTMCAHMTGSALIIIGASTMYTQSHSHSSTGTTLGNIASRPRGLGQCALTVAPSHALPYRRASEADAASRASPPRASPPGPWCTCRGLPARVCYVRVGVGSNNRHGHRAASYSHADSERKCVITRYP